MIEGKAIIGALKVIGGWALKNHTIALDAMDKVAKIQADKKSISNEEHLQIVDEKLNQLGVAALELDQKIDTEIEFLRKQIRVLKTAILTMGIGLIAAVIFIILHTVL